MTDTDVTDTEPLEGIDRANIDAWLVAHVDDLAAPFTWDRLTGGTSNLTYVVTDAKGRRVVVRRPPTGPLLPKAHDMGREYRILSALAPTAVPVAKPFGLCDDPAVTGANFYVMEFRPGHTVRTTGQEYHALAPDAAARFGPAAIEALAALHRLEPEAIGLGDLGRPDAYVARQLDRWADSWARSNEAARLDFPIAAIHAGLRERIPEQGPARVCHGDYGPHNMLADDRGEITAITDWEIGTLGDPLADLAYVLNGWALAHAETDEPYAEGRLAPGHATRAELVRRYESEVGRALGDLSFYVAFNYFKTACIVQGVYARFARGVRSTQGLDVEAFAQRIGSYVRSAEQVLETL